MAQYSRTDPSAGDTVTPAFLNGELKKIEIALNGIDKRNKDNLPGVLLKNDKGLGEIRTPEQDIGNSATDELGFPIRVPGKVTIVSAAVLAEGRAGSPSVKLVVHRYNPSVGTWASTPEDLFNAVTIATADTYYSMGTPLRTTLSTSDFICTSTTTSGACSCTALSVIISVKKGWST